MLYAGCNVKWKSPVKDAVIPFTVRGSSFSPTDLLSAPFCNSSLNNLPGTIRGLPVLFINGRNCRVYGGDHYHLKYNY